MNPSEPPPLAGLNANSPLGLVKPFVDTAVNAFFDNNLMFAVNYFLSNAKGSFGLVVSSSLDADRNTVGDAVAHQITALVSGVGRFEARCRSQTL